MVAGLLFAAGGYMTCSALMLIVNKVAVHLLPTPAFVLFAQLSVAAVILFSVGFFGLAKVDKLEWGKINAFSKVSMIFLATIFTNMKTLQYCNVETFIVFRASTPLLISVCDFMFLGRELPNKKSWICLLGLMAGSIGYVYTDKFFKVTGYMWVLIWFLVFAVDQVYIKHVCDTVKMDSNWGRSFYTNFLGCLPLLPISIYLGEIDQLPEAISQDYVILALGVSCILGTGISYFAFMARNMVSATYFTVIGNMCKIITVIINVMIWDNHASTYGIVCLLVCLGSAYFYEQAPMRQKPTASNDIEVQPLNRG